MDRLLITDVKGLLGASLAAALADRFEVLGLGNEAPADSGCRMIRLPGASDCPAVVRDTAPQWIIHCGSFAHSSWDLDESQPPFDHAADLSPLAAIASNLACRLTVLSTDAVFTGPRMFHAEESPLREENALARTVRELESVAVDAGALVVRTHAYGWNAAAADQGFAQRVWNALDRGQPLRLNAGRHASPILADDLAELLLRAYRRDLRGLYHIAGGERANQHRFAVELAAACGFDPAEIAPLSQETVAGCRKPREETSLDSRRARHALQTHMPLLREGLTRFASRRPSVRHAKPLPRRTQPTLPNAA